MSAARGALPRNPDLLPVLQRKGTVKVVVGATRKAAETSELATAAWGEAFEYADLRPLHDMSMLSTSGTAAYEEKCRSVWAALVRGDHM